MGDNKAKILVMGPNEMYLPLNTSPDKISEAFEKANRQRHSLHVLNEVVTSLTGFFSGADARKFTQYGVTRDIKVDLPSEGSFIKGLGMFFDEVQGYAGRYGAGYALVQELSLAHTTEASQVSGLVQLLVETS